MQGEKPTSSLRKPPLFSESHSRQTFPKADSPYKHLSSPHPKTPSVDQIELEIQQIKAQLSQQSPLHSQHSQTHHKFPSDPQNRLNRSLSKTQIIPSSSELTDLRLQT